MRISYLDLTLRHLLEEDPIPEHYPDRDRSLYEFIAGDGSGSGAWNVVEPGRRFLGNWHLEAICEYLEALYRGEIRRLVINIPPGHMKSLSATVFFPAWIWGYRDPSFRSIFASYSQNLSLRDSLRCRRIIQSRWFSQNVVYPVRLRDDQNAKQKFENDRTGFRLATSTGGLGTGERADLICVDDPLKVSESESERARENVLTWWAEEMSSRGSDPKTARFLTIMQRTHDLDIAGWALAHGYDSLILPSEYNPQIQLSSRPDLFKSNWLDRYRQDGLLWVEQFPRSALTELKEALGSYGYAAQFQQSPVPREGGIIKPAWWKRYTQPPAQFNAIILSWDTAVKAAELNDPWCCTVWGVLGSEFYLLDCRCDRYEYPDGKRLFYNLANQWQPTAILVEDKGSGQSLIQEANRDPNFGWGVIPIKPIGDKEMRLSATTPIIEAGRVFLPEQSDWVAEYESELTRFPKAAHDDRVDSTSQFLSWAQHRFGKRKRVQGRVYGDRDAYLSGF